MDYIYGLGGRDMPQNLIGEIYSDLQKILRADKVEKPVRFIGVR